MTVTITERELLRHGLKISKQIDKCRDKSIDIKSLIIKLFNSTYSNPQPAESRDDIINRLYNIKRQIGFIEYQLQEYNLMISTICTKQDPFHLSMTNTLLNHKFNRLIKRHNANMSLAYNKLLINIE